jgi:serine/threonine protein kinase
LCAEIEILKRADGTDWQLGAGGFGTVYKAMRNGVQPVAVKVLGSVNSGLVLKSMTPSDFAHEISILRACRDTNVLQFQVGWAAQRHAYAYAYACVCASPALLAAALAAIDLPSPPRFLLSCRAHASRKTAHCWSQVAWPVELLNPVTLHWSAILN